MKEVPAATKMWYGHASSPQKGVGVSLKITLRFCRLLPQDTQNYLVNYFTVEGKLKNNIFFLESWLYRLL